MTGWVRLWHDMPTDPKWRTIARKSGQRIGDVIAVFTFLMVAASSNESARGTIAGFDPEDVAGALDLDTADIEAIVKAMQGKVLDGDRLANWDKRQPKREDATAAKRKAEWKERQGKAAERAGTHQNALEHEGTADTDTDTDTDTSGAPNTLGDAASATLKKEYAFKGNYIRLTAPDLERWTKAYHAIPDIRAELTSLDTWLHNQSEAKRRSWFQLASSCLNRKHQEVLASRAAGVAGSPSSMVDAVLKQKRQRQVSERELAAP
ncbi:hypothetical protein EOE18_13165 [Novosphingobium umbonatum]|uniref:DUF1376 domain-containing protein n=1 Tax=Novosphingobium umbonatum TaxID=1908524 RepID=A0A437N2N7_9SPHN|nr:hypothetical protein [Novosphingobium umbonatum]RVU04115.1 hypothetical protein EOE18_13165 [Novosphingobium umbonatum]